MNKNINTVVELTEKELECVTGGGLIGGSEGEIIKLDPPVIPSPPIL